MHNEQFSQKLRFLMLLLVWLLGVSGLILQFSLQQKGSITPMLLLLIQAAVIAAVSFVSAPKGWKSTPSIPSSSIWVTAFLLFGLVLHTAFITVSSFWNSEALILHDVLGIRSGHFPNPFSYSSDFPNRVFMYAAAVFSYFAEDPRVIARSIGVAALLLFSLLLYLINGKLTSTRQPTVIPLPVLSLWMINLSNTADNSWIGLSPILCAVVYYLFLKMTEGAPHLAPAFALSLAVSIWTLYLPMVFSMSVFLIFVLRTDQKGTRRLLLWLIPLLLPLAGALVENELLSRHASFLHQSGEAELQQPLLEGYLYNLYRIAELLIPNLDRAYGPDRAAYLEWPLALLCVFGMLGSIFARNGVPRTRLVELWALSFLLTAATIISNPVGSIWRTVILAFPVFVFAALGLTLLTGAASSLILKRILAALVVCSQGWYFAQSYERFYREAYRKSWEGKEAMTLHLIQSCRENISLGELRYLAASYPNFPVRTYAAWFLEQRGKEGLKGSPPSDSEISIRFESGCDEEGRELVCETSSPFKKDLSIVLCRSSGVEE